MTRPELNKMIKVKDFKDFYWLKEELVIFCRKNNIPSSGSKKDLSSRIQYFLETGNIKKENKNKTAKPIIEFLTVNTKIEKNIVCSQVHRKFFKENIGNSFSFNVIFQNWLKENTGKTYQEAILAYYDILEKKKNGVSKIDSQFEYNTYIRDFFEDNKDKSLSDAILCWKYKKSIPGSNKYSIEDLKVLNK